MIVPILLLILAILGAPLFAIIATSAMVGFHKMETEQMTIALELLSIADMPILIAIPLFTFAGYLLSESDAPKRLVRLTSAMFGWETIGSASSQSFPAFTVPPYGVQSSGSSLGSSWPEVVTSAQFW